MAMQSPFFGKQRESDAFPPRAGATPSNSGAHSAAHGQAGGAAPQMQTLGGSQAGPSGNPQPALQATSGGSAAAAAKEPGSKLTVGPNIKLKGVEITDCDTLVVEGTVEATMDSRVIQISERGAFRGSADIDIAEIHGQFDGNLTVRQKLTIHATGKVTGKIRYGKVVIEEGGQLAGDIEFAGAPARPAAVSRATGIQTAA